MAHADGGGRDKDAARGVDTAGDGAAKQPCERTAANEQGALELVTLSTTCTISSGDTAFSRMTTDGRYVVFESDADDLVPNDLNGRNDVFLVDLETGQLELISKKYGAEVPSDGDSFLPVASDDARYIAFTAYAFELTSPAPPTGGLWVYLRDRQAGTTRRFPADYACAYWVDMSGDAAFIVTQGFSNCADSVQKDGDHDSTLEYDVQTGEYRYLGVTDDGGDNYRPAISRDGRFIVWAIRPPMTRGAMTSQLQVFDREMDTVETLPFYAFGYESTDISDDGNLIAFSQNGQVYRYQRDTAELRLVSKNASDESGNGSSTQVSMSGDGRLLVFTSAATNLTEGDTNGSDDVLLFDSNSGTLETISVAPDGSQADGDSRYPFISGNGEKVSFASKARNLLPLADTGDYQLYVRTLNRR